MAWFMENGIWIVVAVAVAALVWWAWRKWVPKWLTRLFHKIAPASEDWARGSRITGRIAVYIGTIVITAALVLAILPQLGIDIAVATEALKDAGFTVLAWLRDSGIRIAIILAIAFAAQQICRGMIPRLVTVRVTRKRKGQFPEEVEQRAKTLSGFLVGAAIVFIWAIVLLTVLPEFNVNIGALLAGAGVVGIAVGFGAQGLIRDLLAGVFIITEDQYSNGDWIEIAGKTGEVEYIGLRRTVLRDLDGTRHVIPNGEIKISSNLTQDWGCVNLNISVAYGEHLDRATEVINRVCREMAEEEGWRDLIMATPQVLRVDKLGESGIELKIWGRTRPMMQWKVMGELRKRVKTTFDQEGIEIPWPHIKLYLGDKAALNTLSKYKEPK